MIVMKQCHFCGTSLPTGASFCGVCGHVSSQESAQSTYIGDIPTLQMGNHPGENNPTIAAFSAPKNTPSGPLRPLTLVPMEDEEEEERRRRALAFGLGLPL